MMLLILIFIFFPFIDGAYTSGSFTVPKPMPIMSQADLLKAVHKPGLLAWRFNISENSSVTSISLGGLEPIARIAERRRCDLSLRIEVDQNRNISISFNKCGFRSSTSATIMQKEIIIVPPSYFTVISNVGLVGCKDVEEPMLMLINGESNTSGTISFNVLEYPSSAKMLMEDMVIYYFYPLLFGILFALGGCALSPLICYGRRRCIAKLNGQRKTWTEFAQFKFNPGPRGTFV